MRLLNTLGDKDERVLKLLAKAVKHNTGLKHLYISDQSEYRGFYDKRDSICQYIEHIDEFSANYCFLQA